MKKIICLISLFLIFGCATVEKQTILYITGSKKDYMEVYDCFKKSIKNDGYEMTSEFGLEKVTINLNSQNIEISNGQFDTIITIYMPNDKLMKYLAQCK
jgi:hypothetical protein